MRYSIGWPVPEHVLALTHFEPRVTSEDFAGIVAETHAALHHVKQPFHILIDNRRITDVTVSSLETMLHAFPALNHPQLRWIVVVLPTLIKHEAHRMAIQQRGEIRLKYVESLNLALHHLCAVDEMVRLDDLDRTFFEPTIALGSPQEP